ncbi:alpha/beta hydrolase [Sphaerimonospora sp. CA-214678]|uniref:alpha/beta hydrolase n=1 Tax=Sphaerimonospora sp. CA-214678 TaxID=3240029 RepID=UPI003D9191D7
MPLGYLATLTPVAVCTMLALAPLRRPRPLAELSFRLGLAINESPFVPFYWLLAATPPALGEDDLDSPGGWALAGAAVLTMAGLGVIARRGLRAGPVLDRALAEGLGTGRRVAAARPAAGSRPRLPLARILFRPFPVRPRRVERVADIAYGDAGKRNLLDVYRHRSRPSGGPTLVYFHGGGYFSGRKNREARPLLHRLASRGWVCVSANYRLRPAATFPDHLIDVKKVIAWVREHGHEYGADPAVLFVAGSSAGGHLASLAALTPGLPAFQPGFEHADTSVTAAICLYGWYGDYYGQGPASSPLTYLGPDAPPFFIAHGDDDTLVPVADARRFAERLRRASADPVVYAELPGAQHAFDLFHSLRFESVVDAIEAFAAEVGGQAGPTSSGGEIAAVMGDDM